MTSLPPVQFIKSRTEPVFAPLQEIIDSATDIADAIAASSRLFLESAHGVNKAFNSNKTNLKGFGEGLLTKSKLTFNENNLYFATVGTYNETLNLPAR